LSFGQLLAPNLMLLFMPVPHTSLFPWLTGLSRNQLIRYHRCVPPKGSQGLSCVAGRFLMLEHASTDSAGAGNHQQREPLSFRRGSHHCRLSSAPTAGLLLTCLCSWMGHGTMWILTTHAVLYYVYWATSSTAGG